MPHKLALSNAVALAAVVLFHRVCVIVRQRRRKIFSTNIVSKILFVHFIDSVLDVNISVRISNPGKVKPITVFAPPDRPASRNVVKLAMLPAGSISRLPGVALCMLIFITT